MELLFPYFHRVFRWFLLSMLDANGTFVMNPAGCVCVVSLSCMLYKDIMFYSLNNAETVNFLHQSFPVIKKALAMLLTLTAGLLSKEKNNHKRHNLKSWWSGKHLSAGEQTATQHQHSPLSDSLSVHSWFTLLPLFHLTWRELPGETMLLPVLVACRQMCFHLPCESSFVFMGTNLYLDGLVSPEPHHNAISVNFRNISQSSG